MLFKVDFEKAYDSVDWNFLLMVMEKMGFHEKWRSWIFECLRTASVSVLVNGSPTKEFNMGRGLRQGDPLSPFLFLIVAEGFSQLMKKAVDSGRFIGYKFEAGEKRFSHLQYADDTMIISEKRWTNIRTIQAILLLFESLSGLKVNFQKSSIIGINISQNWITEAAKILRCRLGSIPFMYLGLPIGANPNRKETWNHVINIVKSRLSRWKNKNLSIGGRVVMLKSVLFAIPVYYLSFFKAPAGIRNLRKFNLALLGKWEWKVVNERKGIWFEAIVNRYGMINGVLRSGPNGASIWWKDICNLNIGGGIASREYSVKEVYKSLDSDDRQPTSHPWCKIWNKAIPSKVSCLVWRVLQNRIPTKDNLARRGILSNSQLDCVGECGREESVSHIFFECPKFAGAWSVICNWLGVHSNLHNDGWQHLEQFEGLLGTQRKLSLKLRIIWAACVWCIWRYRNNKVFLNEEIQLEKVVEETKILAWRWLRLKSKLIADDIVAWCKNPKACFGFLDD
ncbi:uncharacterized protein LOC131638187 [Vicia villosa]|uniref:uncharacterized protein LOC131638187 n=1 Tax=Vicia villosa TaxID=3911 RepID=UPI00273B5E18|nr:uncharacterized protein LOC131638187 [Vicia villosa]